eukprot:GILK01013003.1.p1 GENE.GILK01013003.1~~GILK01013003.1.p1  ORF type:complete len:196 (+),score=35.33 GILK01013003.1:69-656(+)
MSMLSTSFTPNEIEFMAEDELISIVPNFTQHDKISFIRGEFGPFRPSMPVDVPLWLAIYLKKRHKCQIKPPNWLSLEELTERVDLEKRNVDRFVEMPYHYMEIASLLLNHASDDMPSASRLRTMLEDLQNIRRSKIMNGLKVLEGNTSSVKLNNISAMEINSIRPFFAEALDTFYALAKDEKDGNNAAGGPPIRH